MDHRRSASFYCPQCPPLFGRTITPRKTIGIILGFFGVFLIISRGLFSLTLFRMASTFGDLLVLSSAVTWTAFTVGAEGSCHDFLLWLRSHRLCRWISNQSPVEQFKGPWNIHFHLSLASWISIMFLGIFCSGLAYFSGTQPWRKRIPASSGFISTWNPLSR